MSIVSQQTTQITSTGPQASIDVSTVQGCWVLRVAVSQLSGTYPNNPGILVAIEDSTDNFVNDIVCQGTVSATGTIGPRAPVASCWCNYDLPLCRVGVTSGKVRLNVKLLWPTTTATLVLELTQ